MYTAYPHVCTWTQSCVCTGMLKLAHVHMQACTDTYVQTHIPRLSRHTQSHPVPVTHTHIQLLHPFPHPLHSTWHTGISGDRSRSCLLPAWEWMFLWLLFAGCPEALRPGSACINQYLLLLIIKNKATPCLEHTSLEFPLAPRAPA